MCEVFGTLWMTFLRILRGVRLTLEGQRRQRNVREPADASIIWGRGQDLVHLTLGKNSGTISGHARGELCNLALPNRPLLSCWNLKLTFSVHCKRDVCPHALLQMSQTIWLLEPTYFKNYSHI